jgi:hypothetical protein
MESILNIISKLKSFQYSNISQNIVNIYNENSTKVVCTIYIDQKSYISYETFEYDDFFRILHWFGFKNKDKNKNFNHLCSGLGCENCTGCAYTTLSSLYKSKTILNKYIDKDITENFTFIGCLSLNENLFTPSLFRTYIKFDHGKYSYIKYINGLWNTHRVLDFCENSLYIEQLIPELLDLNHFTKELYGIYQNKAVLWTQNSSNGRPKWVFKELV